MTDTTPPSSPSTTTFSPRSLNHRLFMLIIGCLILSQLRLLSNFVNTGVNFDSTSVENEEKMRYIENEKRKFAAAKGLTVDASDVNKIPYLDDDAVDETVDKTIKTAPPDTPHKTSMITDIHAFCGSCMWNNTKFNCDARVDFTMKRYPAENPTRDGAKQVIMKTGLCVDPNWAPKFIDEEIADVESKAASILHNHSGDDNVDGASNITTSSLLLHNSSSSIHNNSNNTTTQQTSPPQPPPLIPMQSNSTTAIDIVSLTTNKDFFILFNNSAITSWLRHIQNIRSITFIGPPRDYNLFQQNMLIHYPHLLVDTTTNTNSGSSILPIRWVNETHWITTYKQKYRCPYANVCQQLMKLFVFDLRTKLNVDIRNNVLIVDSDTVWSRDVTFVRENGTVTYFEVYDHVHQSVGCSEMDPVAFTEAITMGPSPPVKMLRYNHSTRETTRSDTVQLDTVTPYSACRRAKYPNATGARHIAHHMLFQYDVMMHLHSTITKAWSLSNIWQAFVKCQQYYEFCKSRVAEYELYFSFISFHYPERVHLEPLVNGVNFMGGSSICTDDEMECCREKKVLLKGCHNHRIDFMNNAKDEDDREYAMGDMCCK
jgi:hypothetical protein